MVFLSEVFRIIWTMCNAYVGKIKGSEIVQNY